MKGVIVPPQWERLQVEELCGSVMVLSASDMGKSTRARHLFQRLCRGGVQTAYLAQKREL